MPVSTIRKGSACVADRIGNDLRIDRIDELSVVLLKISGHTLDSARDKSKLAGPLEVSGGDPRRLWLGPDRWLLVSDTMTPDVIIDSCNKALAGIVHNAVDYSAGLAVFRIIGQQARTLLASGTGVDLRPDRFPIGRCCRTRLAQIAAVITAEAADQYDVYVDRSYETYLANWFAESSSICFSYRNLG